MDIKVKFFVNSNRNKIIYDLSARTLDVPYSDCFYNAERWVIYTTNPNANKCILRATMKVVFVKSTIFKGKI